MKYTRKTFGFVGPGIYRFFTMELPSLHLYCNTRPTLASPCLPRPPSAYGNPEGSSPRVLCYSRGSTQVLCTRFPLTRIRFLVGISGLRSGDCCYISTWNHYSDPSSSDSHLTTHVFHVGTSPYSSDHPHIHDFQLITITPQDRGDLQRS